MFSTSKIQGPDDFIIRSTKPCDNDWLIIYSPDFLNNCRKVSSYNPIIKLTIIPEAWTHTEIQTNIPDESVCKYLMKIIKIIQ